jgi:hypothetical protein
MGLVFPEPETSEISSSFFYSKITACVERVVEERDTNALNVCSIPRISVTPP